MGQECSVLRRTARLHPGTEMAIPQGSRMGVIAGIERSHSMEMIRCRSQVNMADTRHSVAMGEALASIAAASAGDTRSICDGVALIGSLCVWLGRIGSQDEAVAQVRNVDGSSHGEVVRA